MVLDGVCGGAASCHRGRSELLWNLSEPAREVGPGRAEASGRGVHLILTNRLHHYFFLCCGSVGERDLLLVNIKQRANELRLATCSVRGVAPVNTTEVF